MPHNPRQDPICLRLPPDMRVAVTQLAEQQGLNISEWIRELIYRAIYGEAPGVDQGYMQGRALGFQVALQGLQTALFEAEERLPPSAEAALPFLQGIREKRKPRSDY
jgi:hypothetical protein